VPLCAIALLALLPLLIERFVRQRREAADAANRSPHK